MAEETMSNKRWLLSGLLFLALVHLGSAVSGKLLNVQTEVILIF
jgi:hypothetical protein